MVDIICQPFLSAKSVHSMKGALQCRTHTPTCVLYTAVVKEDWQIQHVHVLLGLALFGVIWTSVHRSKAYTYTKPGRQIKPYPQARVNRVDGDVKLGQPAELPNICLTHLGPHHIIPNAAARQPANID